MNWKNFGGAVFFVNKTYMFISIALAKNVGKDLSTLVTTITDPDAAAAEARRSRPYIPSPTSDSGDPGASSTNNSTTTSTTTTNELAGTNSTDTTGSSDATDPSSNHRPSKPRTTTTSAKESLQARTAAHQPSKTQAEAAFKAAFAPPPMDEVKTQLKEGLSQLSSVWATFTGTAPSDSPVAPSSSTRPHGGRMVSSPSPDDLPHTEETPAAIFTGTRRERRIAAAQTATATFVTDPALSDPDGWAAFEKDFDVEAATESISELMEGSPAMSALHARLVPAVVSYKLFWARYFFTVHQINDEEDRKDAILAQAQANLNDDDDDDLDAWGDDDDDGGDDDDGKAEGSGQPDGNDVGDEKTTETEEGGRDAHNLTSESAPISVASPVSDDHVETEPVSTSTQQPIEESTPVAKVGESENTLTEENSRDGAQEGSDKADDAPSTPEQKASVVSFSSSPVAGHALTSARKPSEAAHVAHPVSEIDDGASPVPSSWEDVDASRSTTTVDSGTIVSAPSAASALDLGTEDDVQQEPATSAAATPVAAPSQPTPVIAEDDGDDDLDDWGSWD